MWLDVRKGGITKEKRRNQWIKHPSLIYSRFTTLLDDTIVLCDDWNDRKLVYAIENAEEKDRSLLTSNINIYIHIYIRYVTHFIDRQLSWPFLSLSNFLQQNEIDLINELRWTSNETSDRSREREKNPLSSLYQSSVLIAHSDLDRKTHSMNSFTSMFLCTEEKTDFYLLLSASLNAFHIPSDTFCECTQTWEKTTTRTCKYFFRQ